MGPFTIIKRISHLEYKLQLPPMYNCVHPVFHVSSLKPVCESRFHERIHVPIVENRPVVARQNEREEIDYVLSKKMRYGFLQLLYSSLLGALLG